MIPVHFVIDGTLKTLTQRGVFYTVVQRGEKNSGIILLKLWDMKSSCQLLTQQRDLDGDMQWVDVMQVKTVSEQDADSYIVRAKDRDPDLWIIEIEDASMTNPFDV